MVLHCCQAVIGIAISGQTFVNSLSLLRERCCKLVVFLDAISRGRGSHSHIEWTPSVHCKKPVKMVLIEAFGE